MGNKEDDFSRVFIWVLASLVLFTIVVMLLARSIGLDENSGPMTGKDIDKRTMPYGTVKVAGAADSDSSMAPVEATPAEKTPAEPVAEAMPAAAEVAIDGGSLYSACAACHSTGVAGAPVTGNAAAWGSRIATGIDSLVANAINGKGAMPPKGGRADLSNEQIKAIVEYMVAESK